MIKLIETLKKKKGFSSVTLIFLVFVILFAGLLSSGGFSPKKKANPGGAAYTPETVIDPDGEREALQLRTLKFKAIPQTMDCGHEYTGQESQEQIILWAMDPDPGTSLLAGQQLKVFYMDEWPITLGKGTVSPVGSGHVVNPVVGDLAARDSNNFAYFPAIYLTDITNNPSDTSGDAQNGGTPIPPNEIWGIWQPLGGRVSGSTNGQLPAGADPFPAESNIKFGDSDFYHGTPHGDEAAEVIWNVDSLGLTPGHSYRVQIILHDGDREGDIGEACTSISF